MGTTIGSVLLSYDVKSKHTEVKQKLEELGYLDHFNFKNETKVYHLPNTTLWHYKKSSDQALNDLKQICNNLYIDLDKAVSVKATEFVAV